MACPTGKVEHPTREAALDAQKRLVYDNHLRGRSHLSAGLSRLPVPAFVGAWHVGHEPQTPTCYHFDVVSALDDILTANALVPAPPVCFSQQTKRHLPSRIMALTFDVEERTSMSWFTWNGGWDFSCAPHPGVFLNYAVAERRAEGLIRVSVPASIVRLRWSDYLTRNRTTRRRRSYFTEKGNPALWLATDAPVPLSTVRAVEVWYRGAWVNVVDIVDSGAVDDLEATLGS